uniref:Protein kinase domain-containing protein n=1 Tax=Timema bartmani TaxID=61472 RepID=A0A7R9F8M6_9NEOP|nr:unnamed protein product [Timema bartmani]
MLIPYVQRNWSILHLLHISVDEGPTSFSVVTTRTIDSIGDLIYSYPRPTLPVRQLFLVADKASKDLKPLNILLNERMHILLADFGCCHLEDDSHGCYARLLNRMVPGATVGPTNRLSLGLCFHADQMGGLPKKDTIDTLVLLSTFNIATLYKHQFSFLPARPPTGRLLKLLARDMRSACTSSCHDSPTSSYWVQTTDPPSSAALHYTSVVWRSPRQSWLNKKCLTDGLADTFGGSTRIRTLVPWGRWLPPSKITR